MSSLASGHCVLIAGVVNVLNRTGMKDGRKLAAGRLREVLTDDQLSELYDYPCKVGTDNGRYWLRGH